MTYLQQLLLCSVLIKVGADVNRFVKPIFGPKDFPGITIIEFLICVYVCEDIDKIKFILDHDIVTDK